MDHHNKQIILPQVKRLSDSLDTSIEAKMNNKTKPLGSLGKLEEYGKKIAKIQQTLNPTINSKGLLIFAADHGITQEGVSAYPSEVTYQMVLNFLRGGAAINVLCNQGSINLQIVDAGVKGSFDQDPLAQKALEQHTFVSGKIAERTRSFRQGPAMSLDQANKSLQLGVATTTAFIRAHSLQSVGFGEMGIGNTSSASAIIGLITGKSAQQVVGIGAGLDEAGKIHKQSVIAEALNHHKGQQLSGIDILSRVGGFEIGAMAGGMIGAAAQGCVVLVDGLISTASALIASLLEPGVTDYMFLGHKSAEPGHQIAIDHLGLDPILDLHMRLGEGTGAALSMYVLDAACRCLREMASFDDAGVSRES